MENDIVSKFIKRTGLKRIKISDRGYRGVEDIRIIVGLGEVQSLVAANRLFEGFDPLKYNIVFTFPGMEGIYDKADEIITFDDNFPYLRLHDNAKGLMNEGDSVRQIKRSLNEYFASVVDLQEFFPLYKDKIDFKITESTRTSINYLPFLNEVSIHKNVNKRSVVLIPWKKHKSLVSNRSLVPVLLTEKIYDAIVKHLVDNRYHVTCIQNPYTFTLNQNYSNDKVVFLQTDNFKKIIQTIRESKCFFSFFEDLSILGYLAQVPVFSVAERSIYMNTLKDLEFYIFDCTGSNQTIFSFYDSFFNGTNLNQRYISNIIDRFIEFYDQMVFNFNKPIVSSKEIDFKPYLELITKRKHSKFISKFIAKKEEDKHAKS